MNKKVVVLILIIFSAVLIIYLISSFKSVNIEVNDAAKVKNEEPIVKEQIKKDIVDPEKLESEYISQTKIVMSRFDKLSADINADQPGTDPETIKNLIDDLTKINVPTDYKDLHLNLVFAFSRIENYLRNENEEDREAGFELINEVKGGNAWLYN